MNERFLPFVTVPLGLFFLWLIRGIIFAPENPLFAGVLLALAIFLIMVFHRWLSSQISPKSTPAAHYHGTADWSHWTKVKGCNDTSTGLWLGGGVFHDAEEHLLTIAPPGSGKGAAVILPNLLLNLKTSFFVFDPKGMNAFISEDFNCEASGTFTRIIDPWRELENMGHFKGMGGPPEGVYPSGFNPIQFIQSEPIHEWLGWCKIIGEMLIPDSGSEKDKVWTQSARSVIKTYLMHMLTYSKYKPSFTLLYEWTRYHGDQRRLLWLEMEKNPEVKSAIGEIMMLIPSDGSNSEILNSIFFSVTTATQMLEDKNLLANLDHADGFHPRCLNKYNTREVVYLVLPERYKQSAVGWARMVIALTIKYCNKYPKNKVCFLLDEFPMLGKMETIISDLAYSREQNIRAWMFVQSLAQLKNIYGDSGMDAILGSVGVLQAFNINDLTSAEYVSKKLGTRTVTIPGSTSYDKNGNEKQNYNYAARALMTPDEVMRYEHLLHIIKGQNFALTKWRYFDQTPDTAIEKEKQLKKDVWKSYYTQMREAAKPHPRYK